MNRGLLRLAPGWSALRSLGGSRLIRTSYFWLVSVPLVANLLSALGPTVTLRFLEWDWTFSLTLPFSWRLFYFSSVLISLATGVYWMRCPKVVRDFAAYSDFETSGRGPLQMGWLLRDALRGRPDDDAQLVLLTALRLFSERRGEDAAMEPTSPEALLERFPLDVNPGQCFWFIHNFAERARKLSRLGATLLYAAGLALVGMVLVQNFLYVWRIVF